ncbi:SDR family oxidoreductase|uniref:SDR family oxidoreductase n=1 Tax=Noviherbaspirillum sp. L7-7A TaxID=2850560 RepID=UPI001C2BC35A|nr:SDR family oxidoreductase [Noviherbaspirillum sp. L7-7A]MBV0878934.1 SDR family oxidoreductase [Noviherbaspirillum sp. L7-7A]
MDKVKAVLTGHSRGLGAAIAAELAAQGISTLALSRNKGPAAQGLDQVELDLSDTAALAAWLAGDRLASFAAGAGTVLLINNAGMLQPVGPIAAQAPDEVARAISLNVAAPLMLAAAVAALPAAERRVLHVSSGAGRNGYPGWAVYCAGKAALDNHARAAALDVAPGLRICSLAPGVIDTDMQAQIRASDLASFPLRERFEALKREGQLDSPADCARKLLRFLLSDDFGKQPVADLRDV